ncbi:hypothetical protein ONE63_006831 [Megalurothrips usitatus]|uniref:28S ribosomal protein S27, mitochondrial n=1 Tax=Megalurothrips usitatus TaxID=439358 RepID=A0AAV7XQY3_9NEOP|nr:hypothetical protein ONE63_006831 [Megalurothrips usitatus]
MSRLGFVSSKCFSLARKPSFAIVRRTFLSEAYQCKEAWEKRLESPLLKKVNVQTLYQEIDWQYSNDGHVSALDVDIFINANTEKGFMEDVEDVIMKLRRSPDTTNTLSSTHHAAIRILLEAGETKTLLKIISDRLTHGIFPDHFCANLLMDRFLKEKNFAAAARVAVLQMFQEDWENILTTRLAMYSCHMYLKHSDQQWYHENEIVPPVPEPKEVVKVRVKHLKNPYFDDHFDLKDPLLIVGKTLCMFNSKIGGSEQLVSSYSLLGLTLHQKWDQVLDLVNLWTKSKKVIHSEAIQLAKKFLEVKPVADEPVAEDSKSSKSAKPDPQKEAKEAALKAELEIKQKVSEALSSLEAFASSDDLLAEMASLVQEAVKLHEGAEIEEQKKLYSIWEEERVAKLRAVQEEFRKQEALKRIEEQKRELAEKEKEIFFFENEDKLDLMIESKEEALANITAEKSEVKEDKSLKDANYIPPEVFKRQKQ